MFESNSYTKSRVTVVYDSHFDGQSVAQALCSAYSPGVNVETDRIVSVTVREVKVTRIVKARE